ncbi:sigma-54 interaction domain-containing protein [Anaerosalibacter massiliensis]|uniref:Sigma 54-interacting transcriptional regulator n=1 Tax=Anaerosalibacter massiliensis TaxID=1347392 RepID=A0A9X2MJV0_9FIRM|nr:sigma 54-interacting transcriptional regulator [Anaerosalibacter massiliensis]MCR2045380.1 sigma 54-interacting transcriptional regulator [Anaerosalibacter massiliensis]
MILDRLTKTILDSLHEGILIINSEGIVIYVNSSYTKITGIDYNKIVGYKLDEVRTGAMLPNVVKTGKKLLRVKRKTEDLEYIVNMTPIILEGQIRGAISVVMELTDAYKLTKELEKSNKMINTLKHEIKNVRKAKYTFDDIVAEDERSLKTIDYAKKISRSNLPVHIYGESGTGKELFAHAIHNESDRREEPFIIVNCANLDKQLLESELFGYEEGSFTGSLKGGKMGLFEVASGGTIFLDEIAEIDYFLQAKLLRVLQEKTIRRIGGIEEIPVDVRVISATNKSLEKEIEEKRFRQDLFYRINVFPLYVFPLRDRKNDIKVLVRVFMEEIQRDYKRNVGITDNAMKLLYEYNWPGNIRELKNTIAFAANMTEDFNIDIEHFPKHMQKNEDEFFLKRKKLADYVEETEIYAIKKALQKYGYTVNGKKKCSEVLGISLATLYNKISKYNIEV